MIILYMFQSPVLYIFTSTDNRTLKFCTGRDAWPTIAAAGRWYLLCLRVRALRLVTAAHAMAHAKGTL
jgi:hypothetical protein